MAAVLRDIYSYCFAQSAIYASVLTLKPRPDIQASWNRSSMNAPCVLLSRAWPFKIQNADLRSKACRVPNPNELRPMP
jgi:hypothetical protein